MKKPDYKKPAGYGPFMRSPDICRKIKRLDVYRPRTRPARQPAVEARPAARFLEKCAGTRAGIDFIPG
jgi:hypothetical protein